MHSYLFKNLDAISSRPESYSATNVSCLHNYKRELSFVSFYTISHPGLFSGGRAGHKFELK